jgi:hypothetical protein
MLVVSSVSSVGDGGASGILVLPVEIDKIPPYPAKSSGGFRISIKYYAAPLPPSGSPSQNTPSAFAHLVPSHEGKNQRKNGDFYT